MKPHSVTHRPLVSALPDWYGTDAQCSEENFWQVLWRRIAASLPLPHEFATSVNSRVIKGHLKEPASGPEVRAGVLVPLLRNSSHKSEVSRPSFAT